MIQDLEGLVSWADQVAAAMAKEARLSPGEVPGLTLRSVDPERLEVAWRHPSEKVVTTVADRTELEATDFFRNRTPGEIGFYLFHVACAEPRDILDFSGSPTREHVLPLSTWAPFD